MLLLAVACSPWVTSASVLFAGENQPRCVFEESLTRFSARRRSLNLVKISMWFKTQSSVTSCLPFNIKTLSCVLSQCRLVCVSAFAQHRHLLIADDSKAEPGNQSGWAFQAGCCHQSCFLPNPHLLHLPPSSCQLPIFALSLSLSGKEWKNALIHPPGETRTPWNFDILCVVGLHCCTVLKSWKSRWCCNPAPKYQKLSRGGEIVIIQVLHLHLGPESWGS